jgi:hypothetical protein
MKRKNKEKKKEKFSSVKLEVLDEYQFIDENLFNPYLEIVVKSLDLRDLADKLLNNGGDFQGKIEDINSEKELEDYYNQIKEYVLCLVDYDLVKIMYNISKEYKSLFKDFFLNGLINFLLKEVLEKLILNSENLNEENKRMLSILQSKKYPVFIRFINLNYNNKKEKSVKSDKNS